MELYVSLLFILVVLVWYYLKRRFSYWRRHGVEEWEATSVFGNFGQVFAFKETEADVAERFYRRLNSPFGGYYFLWKPILMVKDVDLMKKVMIKDFDHFAERPRFMNFHDTDVAVRSLFFIDAEPWKPLRMAFSHLFTPKRLKSMSDQVLKVCETSTAKFLTPAKNGDDINLDMNLSEITMDVITTSFIGIGLNDQKTFYTVANYINYLGAYDTFKALLYLVHPKIYDFFGMTSLDKRIYGLFSELVKDVLAQREKSNVVSEDLFEYLIKCQKGENKHIKGMKDEEMIPHIFNFFIAGFDTTATTVSFLLYELSKNIEIQDRLRADIENAVNKNNGLTYAAVKDIPYLEWTIKEVTRMYPVLGVLKRVCTKPYKFNDFEVPVGTEIIIPCRPYHYDPQHFENPNVFNPERFADGKDPDVFIPFGTGPRICIGMRFAEMAMKLIISSILLKYDIKPSGKNKEPLKYHVTSAQTNKTIGGLWAKMELRPQFRMFEIE